MPYIENKEEAARSAKYKAEREAKEKKLISGYDKLTRKQQDALRMCFSVLDMYNDETRDMDGDCYKSTDTAVRQLYGKLYQAFPSLRDEEDN
tara:strand:+ start:124 stop:399 length:276 start_codon:yes stop_codon:yes gene_type:complete